MPGEINDQDRPIAKLERLIQMFRTGQVRSICIMAAGEGAQIYDYAWLPEDEDLPYIMMLSTTVHHRLIGQCESLMEDGPMGPAIHVVEEEDEEEEEIEDGEEGSS